MKTKTAYQIRQPYIEVVLPTVADIAGEGVVENDVRVDAVLPGTVECLTKQR